MESWRFLLAQLNKRLWPRAALYGALGLAAALCAGLFDRFVPAELAKPFGGGTVNALLNVLASSLLGVATFSTAAMLTAYTNVSQGATPRAAALITGDRQAQGALATFVGAFIYAVVAFSALGTGYYGGGGRAILFGVTGLMLALVAVTLLRWLDQLLSLARVGHAVDRVERAVAEAMEGAFGARLRYGWDEPPENAVSVHAEKVGYVQNVAVDSLDKVAGKHGLEVWIVSAPGAFAFKGRVLARLSGPADTKMQAAVRDAFTIGGARSFDQDVRFGMTVLGEVASRALSPGVNDPGTAIDVIGTATRQLTHWIEEKRRAPDPPRSRVRLQYPSVGELAQDAFTPIASDGAGTLSVGLRLQKAIAALVELADGEDREALEAQGREALARGEAALDFGPDRERLRRAARREPSAPPPP